MTQRRSRDRRAFLTDAGRYGALLVGGLAASADVESRAQSPAQDNAGDDARAVQEKTMMLRIFGVLERAPGLTRAEARVKSPQGAWGYYVDAYFQATKKVHGQALQNIHNVINDGAYGAEGQTTCRVFNGRDFVAEFAFLANPPARPVRGAGATGDTAAAAPAQAPRRPTLPDFLENGTELTIVTRQVLAQGTRPTAVTGREKGMHFIKMSASVPAADHLKVWQALHAKAVQANAAFTDNLAGFEVMQKLPETASTQPSRCGVEMPVADLVTNFWFKTNFGSAQFPAYVRALRQADQQKAIDGPASYFVRVEEWEVMTQPSYVG